MNIDKSFTFIIIFIFLFVSNCFAQKQNSLKIILTDQNSATINHAVIKLSNADGERREKFGSENAQFFILNNLVTGEYDLEIQSPGFKTFTKKIEIKPGTNLLSAGLEILEVKIDVEVNGDTTGKSFDQAFNRSLTPNEIAALPNNPSEIEGELRRRYGDDIVIRVNGFIGGQLPPKEAITSIKITKSSFDAEFHQIGIPIVDIRTKGGLPKVFGNFAFNFNDAAFNARNAFASERLKEQTRFVTGFLGGPLKRNVNSYTFSLFLVDGYKTNNIIALTPDRLSRNNARSGSQIIYATTGLDHNLNKNHTIHFNYGIEKTALTNAGVGELNLAETGFSSNIFNHRIKISESGIIGKKYVNEFRLEFLKSDSSVDPNSQTVSVTVLNAFTAGSSGIENKTFQKQLTLTDNLLFDSGKHSIKVGGEIQFEYRKYISSDNINGRFIFTSLDEYRNNRPSTFSQRLGSSDIKLRQVELAGYVQDDIRLRRNLQIGVGLRYELQNFLKDRNNISPRANFIYSPENTGKIVFRSGIGVFYQWLEPQNAARILINSPQQPVNLIVVNPAFPINSGSGVLSGSVLPPSIINKAANLNNPYIIVSQTGINYRLSKRLNITSFYTFRRGLNQFRSRDINAPVDGVRLSKSFGRIAQIESSGTLTENSMEIELSGTTIKNTSLNVRYKLAKATNDFGNIFDLPVNSYNLNFERGVSNLDQRHQLSGSFNMPLFGGLIVTPIFRIESPLPYTIITGKDNNNDTVFNDRPVGGLRNTERGTWFKQTDLRLSGNATLFKRLLPKFNSGDGKKSKVSANERRKYSLNFDLTVQNVFNHVNLRNFIGNQSSPLFRTATFASPARQMRVGLSLGF